MIPLVPGAALRVHRPPGTLWLIGVAGTAAASWGLESTLRPRAGRKVLLTTNKDSRPPFPPVHLH